MNPLRRFSLYLWILLSNLPPISVGRLLMPVIFLSSWTVLQAAQVSAPVAFVWAGVFAQAAQIWGALPVTTRRHHHTFDFTRSTASWALAIQICVLVIQVWWCEPWLSQKLVTIYCAVYAAVMALGVWGDRDILNRFAPASKDSDVSLEFRRHVLMLSALVVILVIVVNETLLVLNTTLATRVAALSVLPIVLHYFLQLRCA
ncbi:hypothetical protein [Ruegeria halocynthiae]|uniref:hypothetical protein n=1 Tax=Ruegeria halocynthiae TaxID=985054 RepID=UPI001267B6E1|nr:hypothetical protein [Ruegeria halocynthiae]